MNRKQKIIVSITGIILVSLILIGLTYAYFLTKITGNTNSKSISVTTANLELVYGDGNGILAPTDKLMPGDTVGTKEFTVTNNGNNKVEGYLVIFRDVTNTLLRPEDLVYKVECKQYLNDVETGTCDGVEYETQLPTGTGSGSGVIVSNDIEAGYVQKYKLTLDYLNPDVDQSDDMNKTIEAKIDIIDVKLLNSEKGITNYASDTLAGTIINNSIANKNGTELVGKVQAKLIEPWSTYYSFEENQIPDVSEEKQANADTVYTYSSTYENTEDGYIILTNTKTGKYSDIYQDLVGKYIICEDGDSSASICKNDASSQINWIYKVTSTSASSFNVDGFVAIKKSSFENDELSVISDNDGISYFYRGNVKDNYINFDNKCWRIIRIEGDGSIKLILDDKETTCDNSLYNSNGEKAFIIPEGNSSVVLNKSSLYEGETTGGHIYAMPLLKTYLNGGTYEYKTISNQNGTNKVITKTIPCDGILSENLTKLKDDTYYINNFNNKIDYDSPVEYIYEIEDRIFNKKMVSLSYGSDVESYKSKIGLISFDEGLLSGISMYNYQNNQDFFTSYDLSYSYLLNGYKNIITTSIIRIPLVGGGDNLYLLEASETGENSLRPTVTLINGIKAISGNGTRLNPYEIE